MINPLVPRFVVKGSLPIFLLIIGFTSLMTIADVYLIINFSSLNESISSIDNISLNNILLLSLIYALRSFLFFVLNWLSVRYIYDSCYDITLDGIRIILNNSVYKGASDRSSILVDPEICATRYYKGMLNILSSTLSISILSLSNGIFFGKLFFFWIFIIFLLICPFYFLLLRASRILSAKRSFHESGYQNNVSNIFPSLYDFFSFSEPSASTLVFNSDLRSKFRCIGLYNFIVGSAKNFLEVIYFLSIIIVCFIGYYFLAFDIDNLFAFSLGMLYFGFRALPSLAMAFQARNDIEFGKDTFRKLVLNHKNDNVINLIPIIIKKSTLCLSLTSFKDRFNNLNEIYIYQNTITGFVGKIGVGKSFFLRVTCSSINNASLKLHQGVFGSNGLEPVRAAYVSSIGFLLNGSLLDNIFGFNTISHERRIELISPVIDNYFPEFKILLAVNDISKHELSTGQQCLVSLLRAYFSNAHFLCLDEPSSAMDPVLEESFCRFLKDIRPYRTILMVSHRQRPLETCSNVFTLSNDT